MLKLIKYEILGNFKKLAALLILIVVANLLLMTRYNVWQQPVIAFLSALILVIALVIVFIDGIKLMSKYMYEDSGYLMFTLPQSGKSIIGSRLITALIEFYITSLVAYLFLRFNFLKIDIVKEVMVKANKLNLYSNSIIGLTANLLEFLVIIYFSIILGKVAFRKRKAGKGGAFVIFLMLSTCMGWVSNEISKISPKTLALGETFNNFNFSANDFTQNVSYPPNAVSINIASTTFEVIVVILLFLAAAYMIDRKIDL